MQTVVQVITTVDSIGKAQHLANQLIVDRRAGCVQVDGPIQSVYMWQGQVCEAQEFRLTCKTLPDNCHELVEWLKQHHPYELPEIIVAEESASAEYAAWLSAQLEGNVSE